MLRTRRLNQEAQGRTCDFNDGNDKMGQETTQTTSETPQMSVQSLTSPSPPLVPSPRVSSSSPFSSSLLLFFSSFSGLSSSSLSSNFSSTQHASVCSLTLPSQESSSQSFQQRMQSVKGELWFGSSNNSGLASARSEGKEDRSSPSSSVVPSSSLSSQRLTDRGPPLAHGTNAARAGEEGEVKLRQTYRPAALLSLAVFLNHFISHPLSSLPPLPPPPLFSSLPPHPLSLFSSFL
eukprot:762943-Hanusia_phi.AAC.2